jgi:low temperature requirement protein LtrA
MLFRPLWFVIGVAALTVIQSLLADHRRRLVVIVIAVETAIDLPAPATFGRRFDLK